MALALRASFAVRRRSCACSRHLPPLRRGRNSCCFPREAGEAVPKGLKGALLARDSRARIKGKIKSFPLPRDSRHPWRSPFGPASLFAGAPAPAVGTFPRFAGEGTAVASPASGGSCPEGTEG